MKKVKNILRVLILCMMLSIATGVYAQEVTNISTLEFTKLLKPLDTSNRLNMNERKHLEGKGERGHPGFEVDGSDQE